jgi:hypothetical protein
VYCLPERPDLARSVSTRELDHVIAAVFGYWDDVIPEGRLFSASPQLTLALPGPRKTEVPLPPVRKRTADDDA